MTLLPCPFCGGEAFVATVEHPKENRPNEYRFHGQIMCYKCQATAGTTGFDLTHEEATKKAIAAWNRRADHLPDATKMVSNADRIRSMSDEELARWLVDATVCERVCGEDEYCHGNECVKRVTDWLQQPAKEERHETD